MGVKEVSGEKSYTTMERMGARPSFDLNGIIMSFQRFFISSLKFGYVELSFNPSSYFINPTNKKQKFLKTIRSNKAPIILDSSYGMQIEPYSNIDPNLIKERARLVNTNEKFSQNILTALREVAEEKQQFESQEDGLAEESI